MCNEQGVITGNRTGLLLVRFSVSNFLSAKLCNDWCLLCGCQSVITCLWFWQKIVLKESNHWKVLLSELNIFILSQAYCWACKLIVGLVPWVYTAIVSEIYYSHETHCQGVLIANLHMHHMLYYLYLVFPPFVLVLPYLPTCLSTWNKVFSPT
jgi:hypothetical protein